MRKNSTIDFELDSMSPEDFGNMILKTYQDIEKGNSRSVKDFFGEFRKENQ